MKQIYVLTLILIAAFAITACGSSESSTPESAPTPAPTPEPVAPAVETPPVVETETAVKPVKDTAKIVEKKEQGTTGTMQDQGSKVEGVTCDLATNEISFTFTNIGVKSWNIDQQAGLTDSAVKNVKVFINKYEANKRNVQFHPDTGEQMFGPENTFSENCGGITVLAPGDSATCTLQPVKLNRGTGSDGLKAVNLIWIDSPSNDKTIEFTC